MVNTFNLHDVKTVMELHEENQVNDFLDDGWQLLAVGFESVDNKNYKTYILGNLLDKKSLEKEDDPLSNPLL